MNAKDFYQQGDLTKALAAANEEVKQKPTDAPRRMFLAELLCFAGDLERADKQLDAISTQEPQAVMTVAVMRQLVRAEMARREFYEQGRVPEFLVPPTGYLRCHLEASIRLREGHPDEAIQLLEQAENERPPVTGTCNGQPFDDLRDGDDLTAAFFEVYTNTGKYYWIPMDRVERAEFRPPQRPRDLLWRRVLMSVRGGPDGEVFLPSLYAGSHAEPLDEIRLGRSTDWRGGDGTPTRGYGQRVFLVGDESPSILELKELTTEGTAGAEAEEETDGEES